MSSAYATATHTGLVRSTNEDSLFARPPIFMVADGMGGAQAGEVASGEAVKAFEAFERAPAEPAAQLAGLLHEANGTIHALAAGDPDRAGMGTTVTAALVSGRSVAIAHVGDSRAYRWRDGELDLLTEDHSLVGEMLRQGRISESEAETHPQRSIITRALGIEDEVEVDTDEVGWEPGDIFLLSSDGLSSMVPDTEIASIIGGTDDLETAAAALVEKANAKGGRDNITVVLFSPELAGAETADAMAAGSADTGKISAAEAAGRTGGEPEAEEAVREQDSSQGRLSRLLSSRGGRAAAIAFAVFLVTAGAWLANRYIFYVGVADGNIAIYRGIPFTIGPLEFSSVYSESPVRFDELEPYERERVERHQLRSRSGAENVVENYSSQAEERREEEEKEAERAARTATVPAAPAASTTAGGS